MMRSFGTWAMLIVGVAAAGAWAADRPADDAGPAVKVDAEQLEFFEKKVRPILVNRCYGCHSATAEKLRAHLYLDSRNGWMVGGDTGAAIVPGDPDKSLLIKAVRYKDENTAMPPKRKLPPAEIAVLELWVANGAADPREGGPTPKKARVIDIDAERGHWPYTPATHHDAPAVKHADWPAGDIDRFVLAALEAKNLTPAPDAEPHTLVRRLYYDLIGLPPTPDQVDAFVKEYASGAQAAVEQTVDRLLASPRFGEHWGRKWLDLARYADTNGSDFNATFFNAWKYRDYVIAAFNDDKPYDEFVREQIAGDLLPRANNDDKADAMIATAFLMLGAKMLSERDKEKLRMDIVDEQIDMIGKSIMGLSLGCARCHDHKFDPVPQTDYYALAGIFRSTDTIEGEIQQYVSDWVRRDLPVPGEQQAALEAYEKESKRINGQINDLKKKIAAIKKQMGQEKKVEYLGVVVDDADAKLVGKWKNSTYVPRYVGVGYIHDNKEDKGEKSATFAPDLPEAGEYEVRISYAASPGREQKVPVKVVHAGGETKLTIDESKTPEHAGLFDTVGRFRFEKGRKGSVTVSTEGTVDYVLADAVQFIPVALLDGDKPAVAKADSDAPSDAKMQASELYKVQVEYEKQLEALEKDAPRPVPKAMAVKESDEIEDCRVRIRGEAHNRGDVAPRGFLRVCSPSDAAARLTLSDGSSTSGRAEFARWLTRPDHPLTARVMVNRLWYHLFGEGIVRTVDNFGALAERPSHPELLDTLAADFVADGWSIKHVVRRMITSRAYRMSTRHDDRSYAVDPENRLLWRANRRRLPAEAIRDTLLVVSGQLDSTPSTEPVKTFKKLAVDNGNGGWTGKLDESLEIKRSVYQPVVRGAVPEMMSVFDFADPDMVVGRRPVTNVPAQALLMMNNPFVLSCAAKTADTLPPGASGVDRAFMLILNRTPSAAERQRVLEYIDSEEANGVAEGGKDSTRRAAAWARFVQALFASTDFRMLD
ncbi:MAG: DUF1553 domain-containing protein [Phycisphaera sp.]|nr:DUF1553 domain-containing protein [Phycisphaera sp.]